MKCFNNYLLFPSFSKTECDNTGSRQYLHTYFTKPLKYIMNNKYSVKICLSIDLISFLMHDFIIHEHWFAEDLEDLYFVSVPFTKERH